MEKRGLGEKSMPQRRVLKFIQGFAKSYALLSPANHVDTVVIFVHGLGGHPTTTWRDFHCLVEEYSPDFPWWTTADMFFYAYESLHTPIRHNAELLAEFVESIWHDPENMSEYKHLILVGHSEGGVLIRRMILDRYEALRRAVEEANLATDLSELRSELKKTVNEDYLLGAHLRLFAPACRGTNFSSLVGFLTSFSLFVSAVTASSLVRNELLPDSPVLSSLQVGTEQAHEEFREVSSLYTRPLFGVPDHIVYSESYRGEKPLWDKGYGHTEVCKPKYTHKRPLEFVRK
jgi:hypothetical protein